jgi:integral membrane sensor domain MASE1
MRRTAKDTTTPSRGAFWDILTFDRLFAGALIHLVYWAGLGIIALLGFFAIGAAAGLALHNSWPLAIAALLGGILVMLALGLIWRAACEFYVAISRISDDLNALRRNDEAAAQARKTAAITSAAD